MELLFALVGGLFALLFVLNAVVQMVRQHSRAGFGATLLAFLAGLLTLTGLILSGLEQGTQNIRLAAIVIAGILLVPSLLLLVFERRRADYSLTYSRSVLGIGVAGLLLLAAFFVAPLSDRLLPAIGSAGIPPATESLSSTRLVTPTLTATPSPTRSPAPTFTPSATRTPRPQPSPTNTRAPFTTRTPTFTPTFVNPCLALVNYNLNLRVAPLPDAEVLLAIPYNTTVPVYGRDEESLWWLVVYEDQTGWVNGEFLSLSASCAELPVR